MSRSRFGRQHHTQPPPTICKNGGWLPLPAPAWPPAKLFGSFSFNTNQPPNVPQYCYGFQPLERLPGLNAWSGITVKPTYSVKGEAAYSAGIGGFAVSLTLLKPGFPPQKFSALPVEYSPGDPLNFTATIWPDWIPLAQVQFRLIAL